jgi:hypothetical protein
MLDPRRGYWLAILYAALGYLSAEQWAYQTVSLLGGTVLVAAVYCGIAALWFQGWWEHEPVGHAATFVPAIAAGALLAPRKHGIDACLVMGLCLLPLITIFAGVTVGGASKSIRKRRRAAKGFDVLSGPPSDRTG